LEIVKILLACPGVNPALNSSKYLRTVARNGHTKVLTYLLGFPGVTLSIDREISTSLLRNRPPQPPFELQVMYLLQTWLCPKNVWPPSESQNRKKLSEVVVFPGFDMAGRLCYRLESMKNTILVLVFEGMPV